MTSELHWAVVTINGLTSYYLAIIVFGFVITVAVTALYGFMAPWYKSDTGKSFFGLLAALSLLLGNSTLRIFIKADWTIYVGLTLFLLYIAAMIYIGWHIFKAQIANYYRDKRRINEHS